MSEIYTAREYYVYDAEDETFINDMENFGEKTETYIEYVDKHRVYIEVSVENEKELDAILAPYLI